MANPINRPYLTGMLLVMYQVLSRYREINLVHWGPRTGTYPVSIDNDRETLRSYANAAYSRPLAAQRQWGHMNMYKESVNLI
mmetsp:Transcript_21934/g.65768  ORF Transcript_21934/g.65768 Transcript_21934/m.65768 type:complete len:82 (-) Transcript_21934:786-1031(-)